LDLERKNQGPIEKRDSKNPYYDKVSHDIHIDELLGSQKNLNGIVILEPKINEENVKKFLSEWRQETEKINQKQRIKIVQENPLSYLLNPHSYHDLSFGSNTKLEKDLNTLQKNISLLPSKEIKHEKTSGYQNYQNQQNSIEAQGIQIKMTLLNIKLYVIDIIRTELTIKKGIEMEKELQKIKKENEELKRLFTICEIRKRLEDISYGIQEDLETLEIEIESVTVTGTLKELSNPSNALWDDIDPDKKVSNRIRRYVNELYPQLSNQIHNVQNYGFDHNEPLEVSREHIGNNTERLEALKILFEYYEADKSYYLVDGNEIQVKDIKFE